MIKSISRGAAVVSRGAAVVLSGSSLALAAAVVPADAAAAPGWRTAAVVSVPGDETLLSGVAAVSARDGWAVGYAAKSSGKEPAGLVEHWAGDPGGGSPSRPESRRSGRRAARFRSSARRQARMCGRSTRRAGRSQG